jgi:alanine racemase
MDLTLVDITGMPAAREGSAVTLLGVAPGGAGGAIDANELADRAGTIAHEILSRVGARVPRRFTDSGS